ncbi:Poly(ADP-ribose) glycohydrolase-like protein [Cladobotryum mycophilum]|uniref:poly(ADP-ribose) glycohydrolase n=1 Tax=Cladobotryum mycophilum TaxID=491253 RepID=A0ABR0SGG0_9HYPO
MTTAWSSSVLPNSPTQRCLDRFSILEDQEGEDGLVEFWPLLQEILKQKVTESSQLLDVLDTISNIVQGDSGHAGDYGSLIAVVEQNRDVFFSRLWPSIVRIALKLPEFFPTGTIPILRPGGKLCLSVDEAACLVAHQFLCTLQPPNWRDSFYDFSIWYASDQRHPKAAQMYLTALFSYFERFSETDIESENSRSIHGGGVEFSLCAFNEPRLFTPAHLEMIPVTPLKVLDVGTFSTEQQELCYQGLGGGVVVAANKDIGFGQSATQEELYVGNCPEACPAVLFTPTLEHAHVLVIRGASPMLRISGQRRDISWEVLPPEARRGGRMLLMDALEIDRAEDGELLPDLKPENMAREMKKAYTAFSSWSSDEGQVVWSGLWGCGAFNGDPGVKVVLMWIAASLAGKELRIICDSSQGSASTQISRLVDGVPSVWKVKHLVDLANAMPKNTERLQNDGLATGQST